MKVANNGSPAFGAINIQYERRTAAPQRSQSQPGAIHNSRSAGGNSLEELKDIRDRMRTSRNVSAANIALGWVPLVGAVLSGVSAGQSGALGREINNLKSSASAFPKIEKQKLARDTKSASACDWAGFAGHMLLATPLSSILAIPSTVLKNQTISKLNKAIAKHRDAEVRPQ